MIEKRLCLRLAAMFVVAAVPAFAGPVKRPAPTAARAEANKAPVVLASAEETRVAAEAKPQPSTAPRKAVTPRITSCRCGDPESGPDGNDQ